LRLFAQLGHGFFDAAVLDHLHLLWDDLREFGRMWASASRRGAVGDELGGWSSNAGRRGEDGGLHEGHSALVVLADDESVGAALAAE
jgi:hypothetical protein